MKQIKKVVGFVFTLILVLGSQNFGTYLRYLNINIQYFAECSPIANRATQTQRTTVSTTIKPSTTTPPPLSTTPRANCLGNPEKELTDPRQTIGKHPVSRLFEIQAKNHEHEPIFKDIGQRGQQNKNNVEFHVQVTVKDKIASAWGPTKRDAKRRAAIQMLIQMGLQVEANNSNTVNSC